MTTRIIPCLGATLALALQADLAVQVSLASAPPVVVKTMPAAGGAKVDPGLTTGLTAGTTNTVRVFPKPEELPGKLIFHGRYQHRSAGRDMASPSELWLKRSADGGLNILARLPFTQSWELASSDHRNRLTNYQIAGQATGSRPGYRMLLELHDGMVKLTRRGLRPDLDRKELAVPAGAWFDPNS